MLTLQHTRQPIYRLLPAEDGPTSNRPMRPTALHAAVCSGDVSRTLCLLNAGENPNAASWFGLTPLHICAWRYAEVRRAFHETSAQRLEHICAALLKAGANPRARDFNAQMPAAWAEGLLPLSLRQAMLDLAEAGAWPEDDRLSSLLAPQFDEDGVRLSRRKRRSTPYRRGPNLIAREAA